MSVHTSKASKMFNKSGDIPEKLQNQVRREICSIDSNWSKLSCD